MLTGPYKVGDFRLDPARVQAKTLKDLGESAGAMRLAGGADVQRLAERWLAEGEITVAEANDLRDFGKKAASLKKELSAKWREQDPGTQPALEKRLAEVRIFTSSEQVVRDALREARTIASVGALAGASFGPIGALAAYATYNELSKNDTKAVIDHIEGLKSGTGSMVFAGNKVEQHHQEALWPAVLGLLDEGIAAAKAGNPPEIDAQYYELTCPEVLERLKTAAEAGCKVRVNLDPALRLSFPDAKSRYDVDDVPLKFRSILQLTELARKESLDVAVSIYPVAKLLSKSTDLMHRKVLRVGDKVLLSGMNANLGSGENVDSGYILEGPAAAALVRNFKRDCQESAGAEGTEIFGEDYVKDFHGATLTMGMRGLTAVLDCMSGLQPAGVAVQPFDNFPDLERRCQDAGVDLRQMFDLKEGEFEAGMKRFLAGQEKLVLSDVGKEMCARLFRDTLEKVKDPLNQQRIQDVTAPADRPVGKAVVAIADVPAEREAAMLFAISQADKFVYMPEFVITRAVAAALAARVDELKAQGKSLDVKVIADPGVYPRGDTPNSWGVKFLEDKGLPVRWAMLPRTCWHDRKIHAKQILTDKCEMFGSTNFSTQGMRHNWETSGLVFFDESDPESVRNRDESVRKFNMLWERESIELSTVALAARWKTEVATRDQAEQIEEVRNSAVRKIIGGIDRWEKESAVWMGQQASLPGVAQRSAELRAQGMSEGYALYQSVKTTLGEEKFYAELKALPARQSLDQLTADAPVAAPEEERRYEI